MIPHIIDVEASGFGNGSYPIEVGVALGSGERFSTLIRPRAEWTHWDAAAERTHRIARATLERHGRSVREVAERLNHLLADEIVYSDGWVVDKPWVDKLFYAAGVIQHFSVSPLELILSEIQMQIWHHTKNQVVRAFNLARHRASMDAWIIQETYRRTRNRSAERTGS